MSTYAEHFTPELFFVTCVTVAHEPVLGTSVMIHLLRTILNAVKQTYPFRTLGYIFLPDHIHLLVKLSTDVVLDQIVDDMREQFNQDYQALMGLPQPMQVWQTHYQAHKILEVEDFAARMDYVHYDAVHHKWSQKPEAWPYSSYQAWGKQGLYQTGWGWTEPPSVHGKRWG